MDDCRGLEVSTQSTEVIDAVNHFCQQIIGAGDNPMPVLDAAAAQPGSALLNLYAAALYLFGQSEPSVGPSAGYLANAAPLMGDANRREQLLFQALSAWHTFAFARAKQALAALTAEFPRDVVAGKFLEFLYMVEPDYDAHLAAFQATADDNADLSHYNAMLAFAYDLAGQRGEAERIALHAIDQDLRTPWAHHALAHVHTVEGRVEDGLAGLNAVSETWQGHDPGIFVHNWWHVALFHLANLDFDSVLGICGKQVTGPGQESIFRYVDLISLFWRLELAGAEIEEARWTALADEVSDLAAQRIFPFLNAHHLYALGRAGCRDQASDAIAKVEAMLPSMEDTEARIWANTGLPVLRGCLALAAGDHASARDYLAPAREAVASTGGSEAQNDLFVQTYLVSLLETGDGSAARDLLDRRTANARRTALDRYWYGRVA